MEFDPTPKSRENFNDETRFNKIRDELYAHGYRPFYVKTDDEELLFDHAEAITLEFTTPVEDKGPIIDIDEDEIHNYSPITLIGGKFQKHHIIHSIGFCPDGTTSLVASISLKNIESMTIEPLDLLPGSNRQFAIVRIIYTDGTYKIIFIGRVLELTITPNLEEFSQVYGNFFSLEELIEKQVELEDDDDYRTPHRTIDYKTGSKLVIQPIHK